MLDLLLRGREEIVEDVVGCPVDVRELLQLKIILVLRLHADLFFVCVNLKYLGCELAILRFLVRKDHLVNTLAELTYNVFFFVFLVDTMRRDSSFMAFLTQK